MKIEKNEIDELIPNTNTVYNEASDIPKDLLTIDKSIKLKLIIFGAISGICFAYMLLVPFIGLGMPIFAIVQFSLILYLIRGRSEVENRKALLMFVPIFILTLSYFLRSTYRFQFSNFLVIFVLYSTMVLLMMNDLGLKSNGILFVKNIISTIFKPLLHFHLPFKWITEDKINSPNKIIIKKVIIGLLISVPCLLIITTLLINADLVFENKMDLIFNSFYKIISLETIFKIIIGTLAGLYLFGLFYIIFKKNVKKSSNEILLPKPQGDLIITSVVLISILIIYTLFAIIQFKYLFAGAALPNDLTYAEYARKGFFELLFLSFINIGLILVISYLLKDKLYSINNNSSIPARIIKALMLYLCAITILLLVSSFYRMSLYNNEYGYTELRLLVITFLIFEAIGLLVTFFYIIKPKFNIIAFYSIVCLVFYLTVNMLNIDYMIAKKNIDMYYEGKELDIQYLNGLSSDAASQMKRLLNDKDAYIQLKTINYFDRIDYQANYTNDWRCFNLSRNNAKGIIKELNLKFNRE